ncbi:hypothetical protein LOS22_15990 [Enterococcus faecium]|nr:hypothetical protein [Enterococcus faecium]
MTTHLSARVIKEFVIQGGALDGSGDEAVSSYEGFSLMKCIADFIILMAPWP